MKWIILPLAVGVLVGVAISFIPPAKEDIEPYVPPNEAPGVVIFPFPEGPRMAEPQGQVLLLSNGATPDAITWPGSTNETSLTANITWYNDKIGTIDIEQNTIYCIRAPCPQPAAPWSTRFPDQDATVVGPGNETIRVTLYIFDYLGELVASNAPASTLGDFRLSGDFIPISSKPWYVGNASAPDGAHTLPFGQDIAAAALNGLGTGAIATVFLETHPYDWYIGELWLTARIDSFA